MYLRVWKLNLGIFTHVPGTFLLLAPLDFSLHSPGWSKLLVRQTFSKTFLPIRMGGNRKLSTIEVIDSFQFCVSLITLSVLPPSDLSFMMSIIFCYFVSQLSFFLCCAFNLNYYCVINIISRDKLICFLII